MNFTKKRLDQKLWRKNFFAATTTEGPVSLAAPAPRTPQRSSRGGRRQTRVQSDLLNRIAFEALPLVVCTKGLMYKKHVDTSLHPSTSWG